MKTVDLPGKTTTLKVSLSPRIVATETIIDSPPVALVAFDGSIWSDNITIAGNF